MASASGLFVATLLAFAVLMGWYILAFTADFRAGMSSVSFASGYWLTFVLSLVLPILLGLSLHAARGAVRWAPERIRHRILIARASFYTGIGLTLETVLMFGTWALGSRYGPSQAGVLVATEVGLILMLPFVVVASVFVLRSALRQEASERTWTVVGVVAALLLVLAVPLLAGISTTVWLPPPPSYMGTPPGVYWVLVGAGLEAALAFLLATAIPAAVMAPPALRPLVRVAVVLGVGTVLLGVYSLALEVSPAAVMYLYPPVFGFYGVPWFMWGVLPSTFGLASGVLLLLVYLALRTAPPLGAASPPMEASSITGAP